MTTTITNDTTNETATAATSTKIFPRFSPGQLVATPGALDLLAEHSVDPASLLRRHLTGDWGTLCSDDAALNDAAIHEGSRILSSYAIAPGMILWVITDAEAEIDEAGNVLVPPRRLCTTILRPAEY